MVKWNRRVVDVQGYSPEELLNMPALAFVPPEEQPRTAEADSTGPYGGVRGT